MTRIVIVDDNKNRRESLKALINSTANWQVSGVYENCKDINLKIEKVGAEVVLMDIDMPLVNGIDGVKAIRKNNQEVKIIMQTVFEDDDKIFNSLQAGANGYILKKTDPLKIIDAIEDVLNGGAPLTPQIANKVIAYFSKPINNISTEEYDLTIREKEILNLLANGKSYKMIASELDIAINTVNNHIKKIYKKLHVNSATEAILKAR